MCVNKSVIIKILFIYIGERSVYKKRGEQDPEVGTPQEKPKRMKLVVDVSGSMYRLAFLIYRVTHKR